MYLLPKIIINEIHLARGQICIYYQKLFSMKPTTSGQVVYLLQKILFNETHLASGWVMYLLLKIIPNEIHSNWGWVIYLLPKSQFDLITFMIIVFLVNPTWFNFGWCIYYWNGQYILKFLMYFNEIYLAWSWVLIFFVASQYYILVILWSINMSGSFYVYVFFLPLFFLKQSLSLLLSPLLSLLLLPLLLPFLSLLFVLVLYVTKFAFV